MANEITLETILNREHIITSKEDFVVYALLKITPSEEVRLSNMPVNLCLVLDRSGSMYDDKQRPLKRMIKAAKHVVDILRPEDMLTIIVFAERAETIVSAESMTDKATRDKVKHRIERIDRLHIGGSTAMTVAIQEAGKEMDFTSDPNKVNRIILFTDGAADRPRDAIKEAEFQAKKGHIFSCFGLGTTFEEEVLKRITKACNGRWDYIERSEDIPKFFEEELKVLQAVGVKNVKVDMKLSTNMHLLRAIKMVPDIIPLKIEEKEERVYEFSLGDVHKGIGEYLLLEILLPPRADGRCRVAKTEVTYDIPQNKIENETITSDLVITYTDDQSLASQINTEVMKWVDEFNVYRMVEKAQQAEARGEKTKATGILSNAIKVTTRLGNKKKTQALNKALNEMSTGEVSSATTKLMKSASKKTSRLSETIDYEV